MDETKLQFQIDMEVGRKLKAPSFKSIQCWSRLQELC